MLMREELYFKHVILYYYDLKKTHVEAHDYIINLNIYQEQCIPSLEKVEHWYSEINMGTLFTYEYGHSTNTLSDQSEDELQEVSEKQPESQSGTDNENRYHAKVINKLKEDGVEKKKFSSYIVPYRYLVSLSLLSRERCKSFLNQLVVGSEEWISYDDFERQSTSSGYNKDSKTKVKLCIWWNSEGVLFYELLEDECLDRYSKQLSHVQEIMNQKQSLSANKNHKVILLHNSFTDLDILESVFNTISIYKWELLPHSRYSSDIDPSDYYLFSTMWRDLQTAKLNNLQHIHSWIKEWIASKQKEFWRDGIYSLIERWQKVIRNDGEYFE